MVNNTAMRIPAELRPKVELVRKTTTGWSIELAPGFFCLHSFDRTVAAKTKREALLLLERAVVETFYEEDREGRKVAERLTIEQARRRYPALPEGHTLKSTLTDAPAQYVIPGLHPCGAENGGDYSP